MVMKLVALLSALAVTACGQNHQSSSIAGEPSTAAPKSLCEAYAQATASEQELEAFKVVKPSESKLSPMELAMIQTAVLLVDTSPVTPQAALDIFTDKENGGSLGGDISYSKLKVRGKD